MKGLFASKEYLCRLWGHRWADEVLHSNSVSQHGTFMCPVSKTCERCGTTRWGTARGVYR